MFFSVIFLLKKINFSFSSVPTYDFIDSHFITIIQLSYSLYMNHFSNRIKINRTSELEENIMNTDLPEGFFAKHLPQKFTKRHDASRYFSKVISLTYDDVYDH